MEVRGQQPGGADEAQQRFRQAQAELSQANRARVRRARQALQSMAVERLQRRREANRQAAAEAREKGKSEIRDRARHGGDAQQIESITKSARAHAADVTQRSERTRQRAAAAKEDRVELSKTARFVSERVDEGRQARVEELRRAHERGTLNSPERIAKAAQRLLGD